MPECIADTLRPVADGVFIDATAGFGGHARIMVDTLGENGQAFLVDQDPTARADLQASFCQDARVHIMASNFRHILWETLPPAQAILFDLGVSSAQLDEAERGFSFQHDGPLDMRMDPETDFTAATIVNTWNEERISDILWRYGEERQSRAIARAILAARQNTELRSTEQLRNLIHATIGNSKRYRIDSATRSFQALRIAVNDELTALSETLPRAASALAPGGRLAVISFHSLEDRIVKQIFRQLTTARIDPFTGQIAEKSKYVMVTKKPLIASGTEIDSNPRARSAKLRVIQAVENKI